MVLRLQLVQKQVFWVFLWVTKQKPFSGKVRQSVQNCLNSRLVIKSSLENGFEATLKSKTNVLRVWKWHFSLFCKFLSDNVKTVFWKSEGKHSKLFESKVGHRKFFRKWFCSYLVVKSECSDCLKIAIFSFLYIFEWRSWNRILGKQGKAFKIV